MLQLIFNHLNFPLNFDLANCLDLERTCFYLSAHSIPGHARELDGVFLNGQLLTGHCEEPSDTKLDKLQVYYADIDLKNCLLHPGFHVLRNYMVNLRPCFFCWFAT